MADSSSLGIAVIGCGLIGARRAAALARIAGVRIVAVCDRDPARAESVAKNFPGCAVRTAASEALRLPGVAAVVVATPHVSLAEIARDAASLGLHVLLEKPGAISVRELESVAAASAASGARVRLGYNHRFHPALRRAREIVDAGEIGPLMFLRARYGHGGRVGYEREWRADPALSGGGELIDQGVHVIDLAGWFLGDFSRVEGHVATYFWNMPVDDNAFVSLRTAGGQTAWLHVSCTEWKNLFSLELYGRTGKLAIDGLGGSYGVERLTYYRMRPEMGPPDTTVWEFPHGDDSWERESAAFIDDIRTGREPSPGLAEGLRTLRVVEEVYRLSAPGSGSPTPSGSDASS
jgi:predicted dehydrogenase